MSITVLDLQAVITDQALLIEHHNGENEVTEFKKGTQDIAIVASDCCPEPTD